MFNFQNSISMKYNEIVNIKSYECLCGVNIPDSATDFQRASITLAHMMASVRESVLKGFAVPTSVVEVISILADIMLTEVDSQS